MAAIVSGFKTTDLSLNHPNEHIRKLFPKNLTAQRVQFEVSNVSHAVSNGIRRTIMEEMLACGMYIEYSDVSTTDTFILPEMIMSRISMIPLLQTTPLDAVFSLQIQNDTVDVMDVKTAEIKVLHAGSKTTDKIPVKSLPFNETFTLLTLMPGKKIEIKNIRVRNAYAKHENGAGHVLAFNAVSLSLDVTPIDLEQQTGVSSRVANPRKWLVKFNTNGTMLPKKILSGACKNIIQRVQAIKELLYAIQNNGNEYTLVVQNETDTVGNLFMRTICDNYPGIKACVYKINTIDRTMTLTIVCNEDINSVYNETIKYITKIYTDIDRYFQ